LGKVEGDEVSSCEWAKGGLWNEKEGRERRRGEGRGRRRKEVVSG